LRSAATRTWPVCWRSLAGAPRVCPRRPAMLPPSASAAHHAGRGPACSAPCIRQWFFRRTGAAWLPTAATACLRTASSHRCSRSRRVRGCRIPKRGLLVVRGSSRN
jgi:hypothetical protein